MELIREHLNEDFHQILLCDFIFAVDDLLKDTGQNSASVHLYVHALQLRHAR